MTRWFWGLFPFFFCFIVLSAPVSAHGHHEGGNAQTEFADMAKFLEAVFVEVERTDDTTPDARRILFVGAPGQYFSMERSKLTAALTKALELAHEDHCSHSHCEKHCSPEA